MDTRGKLYYSYIFGKKKEVEPVGYTVSISDFIDDSDWVVYYSLDNGTNWVEITGVGTLSSEATQIKFKITCYGNTPMNCTIQSTTLGLNFFEDGNEEATYYTDNYLLTEEVTDIEINEQSGSLLV